MRIVEVTARVFAYVSETVTDSDGHSHPGPAREARQALLTVTCDDGTAGHTIAPPSTVREDLLAEFVRPVLRRRRSAADREALVRTLQVAARQRRQAHRPGLVRGRARLVGPGRQGRGAAGVEAPGRLSRPHPGLCQHHVRRRSRGRAQDARGLWPLRRLAGAGARLQGREAAHLDAADPGCPRRAARLPRLCGRARGGRTGRAADAGPQPLVLARRMRSGSGSGWRSWGSCGWRSRWRRPRWAPTAG